MKVLKSVSKSVAIQCELLIMIILLIWLALAQTSLCQYPMLDGFPVRFQMNGPTTYMPNSGSGMVSGYNLILGYMNHEWLAVEMPGTTNEVMVIQQNPFYTTNPNDSFSGHLVSMADYNIKNNQLVADVNTLSDLNAVGYMKSRNFSIIIKRSTSSNGGEDWNGIAGRYSVQQVCFYTSSSSFDSANWKGTSSVCGFYEITNYYSTYRGTYLKDIRLNGYPVSIYGFIGGPYVSINVFFYHATPFSTYTVKPAVILELGAAVNSNYQDFNVFGILSGETGDYYGTSVSSLQKDTVGNGFQNSGLNIEYQNANSADLNSNISGTNLKISYKRNVSSHDSLDKQLLSTFTFCLYIYAQGSISTSLTDKYCDVVQLTYSYPRMSIATKYEQILGVTLLLLTVLLS